MVLRSSAGIALIGATKGLAVSPRAMRLQIAMFSAGLLPALSAANIEPMRALRTE